MYFNRLDPATLDLLKQKAEKRDKCAQLGKVLKYMRLKRGLTQKQIAGLLKMHYQNYQRYEYGIYKPKPNRLKKFCDLFSVDPEILIKEFYI